jgi:hypothetical protein
MDWALDAPTLLFHLLHTLFFHHNEANAFLTSTAKAL